MMLNLFLILTIGVFARRAIMQYPELESVAWILVILGVIAIAALHGRLTVLEVP